MTTKPSQQVETPPTLAAGGAGDPLHPPAMPVKTLESSKPNLGPVPASAQLPLQQPQLPTVEASGRAGSNVDVTVADNTKKVSPLQPVLE